jgi:blue copper oxidase
MHRLLGGVFWGFLTLLGPIVSAAGEPLPVPPILESVRMNDGTRFFELTADEGSREFYPGSSTKTLGYNGEYLGPTIRVRRGDKVAIQVNNLLADSTSVHWHGADVPADSDGGPHQGISPQDSWLASFEVRQPAATLWYHPHIDGTTGRQVYEGLAGLFIIDDDESDSLDLPGEYGVDDIPVILQDRRFDADGKFTYRPSMPDVMHGYFGNAILVNGVLEPVKEVPRGPVRLRLLNGSNSTLLRLTLDGLPEMIQIASDGGFLKRPVGLSHIILSPGERVEVIADFSQAGDGPWC